MTDPKVKTEEGEIDILLQAASLQLPDDARATVVVLRDFDVSGTLQLLSGFGQLV